jgi:tetraacyldisaccharide 4'-kinase
MISRENYIREVWEGKRSGLFDTLLVLLLTPFSAVYSLVMRVREILYRTGILRCHALPKPVISVGNISVGGTGKTPMVILLARLLLDRGKRVAVLSRGYGGDGARDVRVVSDGTSILLSPEEAGDEPFLIARSVPGLIVVTGADRYRAGLEACERFQPDILLLDDGFQHLRLLRNLNILLLDCRRPFGNGYTLPAGLLREPRSATRRADLVVYTRCGAESPPSFPGIPCFRSSHCLRGVVALDGGAVVTPCSTLRGRRGVAFAGIADPGSFFASLKGEGLELTSTVPFPDHCRYDRETCDTLREVLKETGGEYLITTEKDAVKLTSFSEIIGEVYAVVLALELDDPRLLEREVQKLL